MNVLIIDDDIELCKSLKFLLEHEGFDVDLGHDGLGGRNQVFKTRYDVIILDMKLPILNGSQVLKAIRDKGIMMPIIIMSASEEWTERNSHPQYHRDDKRYHFPRCVPYTPKNVLCHLL